MLDNIIYNNDDAVHALNKNLYNSVLYKLIPKKYTISSNVIPLLFIKKCASSYIDYAIQLFFLSVYSLKH